MKKILIPIVLLFSLFILVACGGGSNKKPKPDEDKPTVTIYKITFDVDGGSPVTDLRKNAGETLGTLPVITKDGYTFEGWFEDKLKNVEAKPTTIVQGNMTIYAKWSKIINKYTLTFNSNQGSLVTAINEEEGTKINKPENPTKDGYTFISWTTDEALTNNVVWPFELNEDTTIYAKWEKDLVFYTLTFNTNGGSQIGSMNTVEGSIINKPKEPTKEGYSFVNWTTDEAGENVVEWPLTLNSNITIYAVWNEKVIIGEYLSSLLESYKFDPQELIPEKLTYGGKLTTNSSIESDYNNFVNINDIEFGGYGEQWQMVLDNLNQANNFFTVLKVVDTLSASSVVAFNNYLDKNPNSQADYEFTESIYTIHIEFKENVLSYIIEYSANIPVFGEQTVQIYLDYNIETLNKTGRIQIGEANAIKYELNENGYKIASSYAGFRTSLIEVNIDESDLVTGKIHEHMTVAGKSISSAAQFTINDEYLSVVGNKAGAIIGFSGTIVEEYDVITGNLLGYKVQETLSKLVYNTYFFNLNDQLGITNIKITKDSETNKDIIYVNNGTTKFETKNFGGLTLKNLSRRYDIEYRTQYFYVLENEEVVKVEVLVPMIFVQEEKYDDLAVDIIANNSDITLFSLTITNALKLQLDTDYETLIPVFDLDKELINYEYIKEYIGSKKV